MERIVQEIITRLQKELILIVQLGHSADLKLSLNRAQAALIQRLQSLVTQVQDTSVKNMSQALSLDLPHKNMLQKDASFSGISNGGVSSEIQVLRRTKTLLIAKMEAAIESDGISGTEKGEIIDELSGYVDQVDFKIQQLLQQNQTATLKLEDLHLEPAYKTSEPTPLKQAAVRPASSVSATTLSAEKQPKDFISKNRQMKPKTKATTERKQSPTVKVLKAKEQPKKPEPEVKSERKVVISFVKPCEVQILKPQSSFLDQPDSLIDDNSKLAFSPGRTSEKDEDLLQDYDDFKESTPLGRASDFFSQLKL